MTSVPHPNLAATTTTIEVVAAVVLTTEAAPVEAVMMIDHITEMAIVTATTRAVEVHLFCSLSIGISYSYIFFKFDT